VNVQTKSASCFAKAAEAGFSDSTGMLFEELADINYLAKLKDGETYATGRDELYAAAKSKLEVAVQQAIALETANFAVHMTFAEKLFGSVPDQYRSAHQPVGADD
jgi:hypothetical protein